MKILFISNRYNVLKTLLSDFKDFYSKLELYILKDSMLEKEIQKYRNIEYTLFTIHDKEKVLSLIYNCDYDILISNGCPFIIKTGKLKIKKKLLNIHPTYLPDLRGKTPINGVYFKNVNYYGATVHFINDDIDAGNIIYQEKYPVTDDLDIGLIYYLSFKLEGQVFAQAFRKLINSDFSYTGYSQKKEIGCYYNRTDKDMLLNFKTMATKDLLLRIKSFGIKGQGCKVIGLKINTVPIHRIYDAQNIFNSNLLEIFKNNNPGNVVLEYDEKILVKTIDGLIKITRYE